MAYRNVPPIIAKLAAECAKHGEGKDIIKHYARYGRVPDEYRERFYEIGFDQAKAALTVSV